jgi:hypothetical protein
MKIPIGIQPEKESIPEGEAVVEQPQKKSGFFSSLAARLFFLMLLIGDVLWLCYALALLSFSLIGSLITLSRVSLFSELRANAVLTIKRALVCGLSLFVALFSPAFGIMIACTYFLMYDRGGIEDVVPSSLQTQFKEFLHR